MVRLSKQPVNKEKLEKVYKLLYEILRKAKNENEFLSLTKDLLSPTEQLMIAKRIAIIYLILKNVDTESICDYLKVSRGTVAKFKWIIEEKKDSQLPKIIKSILKKEKISHFFEDLFANLLLQPGLRIGHMKQYIQHKIRQQEREMIDA